MHKINHLLDLWEKRVEGLIIDGKRSPTSLDTYRRAVKNHIRPALGELRIGEPTTPRIDTVLTKIKTTAGAPTAKTCRTITSGAMKLAVRYGATAVNPVREADTTEAQAKNPPRALTADEVTLLRQSLAADERVVEADLPDLTSFMLATGVRIGESLAVLWHQIDLDSGTVQSPTPSPASRARASSARPPSPKLGSAYSTSPNGPPPCSAPVTPQASVSAIQSSPTPAEASATHPTPGTPSARLSLPLAATPAATSASTSARSVAASGSFANPHVPPVPGVERFGGEVLHVADYREPKRYAGRRVVVVGAGNSAVQLAYKLAEVATVTLAVRAPVQFVPQAQAGRDTHFSLHALRLDLLPTVVLSRLVTKTLVFDTGPYAAALRDGSVAQRPMFSAFTDTGVTWADGNHEAVDVVVFATGYRPHLCAALVRWARPVCRCTVVASGRSRRTRCAVFTATPSMLSIAWPRNCAGDDGSRIVATTSTASPSER